MCQWICILFFVLFSSGNNIAQIAPSVFGEIAINEKEESELIYEVKSGPCKNTYNDVSGTPFFNETYKFSNITLQNGRLFVNVRTRIDLVIQQTYFISSNGIEINIEPGMVKEVSYADTTADGIVFYKFQTGFPPIDRQNKNNFYLVLTEGPCRLVKSIFKKVNEKKDVLFGEVAKEYELFEDYYLLVKGDMKKMKNDKDFFLTELSDKKVQIDGFLQANKLNFKNKEHLIRLVGYYNTL